MPFHKRTQAVAMATLDIKQAIMEIADRAQLTFPEVIYAFSETMAWMTRDALRRERHPNDPNKGADEE